MGDGSFFKYGAITYLSQRSQKRDVSSIELTWLMCLLFKYGAITYLPQRSQKRDISSIELTWLMGLFSNTVP